LAALAFGSERLGVSQHSLYAWTRQMAKVVSGDAGKDAEIRLLKRELARATSYRSTRWGQITSSTQKQIFRNRMTTSSSQPRPASIKIKKACPDKYQVGISYSVNAGDQ
jgi:hypothetical protein